MKKVLFFLFCVFTSVGFTWCAEQNSLDGMTVTELLEHGLQTPPRQSAWIQGQPSPVYPSAEAQAEAWLNRPPMTPPVMTTEEIARLRAMFLKVDASPTAGVTKRAHRRRPTHVNSKMSRGPLIENSRRSLTYTFNVIAAVNDGGYDASSESE